MRIARRSGRLFASGLFELRLPESAKTEVQRQRQPLNEIQLVTLVSVPGVRLGSLEPKSPFPMVKNFETGPRLA